MHIVEVARDIIIILSTGRLPGAKSNPRMLKLMWPYILHDHWMTDVKLFQVLDDDDHAQTDVDDHSPSSCDCDLEIELAAAWTMMLMRLYQRLDELTASHSRCEASVAQQVATPRLTER